MEKEMEIVHTIEIDIKKVAIANAWQTAVFSILGFVIYIIFNDQFEFAISFSSILLFVISYIILIVLHEFFHLLGFWVYGKVPWRSMDFGVNLSLGVAYATTAIPIPNKAMKKALLLPFWVTGVIPMVIGYIDQSLILVLVGAWLIAGAVGDFAMYKELKKYPNDILIKDHPTEPKLYVVKPKEKDED